MALNYTKFRVHYRYREWIGKPDPSDVGTTYLYSNDYGWLQEQIMRLTANGNQIIRIQRNDNNGNWKTI